MTLESHLSKLDVDDSLFEREDFVTALGKSSSREELQEFVEQLRRSCAALKTEKISFINDKYPEVVDAIQILTEVEDRFKNAKLDLNVLGERIDEMGGDFVNIKSPSLN